MINYHKVFKRYNKILVLSESKGFQITYIYKKKKMYNKCIPTRHKIIIKLL